MPTQTSASRGYVLFSGVDKGQDVYKRQQQKCEKAIAEGKFDDEIVPVPVKVKKETVMFAKDEGPRPGTTAESLLSLIHI